MIYLLAGKDWMARFNLAWFLQGAPGGPEGKTSATTDNDGFEESQRAMVAQRASMRPGVLSAQRTRTDSPTDPHGILVGRIRSRYKEPAR